VTAPYSTAKRFIEPDLEKYDVSPFNYTIIYVICNRLSKIRSGQAVFKISACAFWKIFPHALQKNFFRRPFFGNIGENFCILLI
jgi:hypothetical protein